MEIDAVTGELLSCERTRRGDGLPPPYSFVGGEEEGLAVAALALRYAQAHLAGEGETVAMIEVNDQSPNYRRYRIAAGPREYTLSFVADPVTPGSAERLPRLQSLGLVLEQPQAAPPKEEPPKANSPLEGQYSLDDGAAVPQAGDLGYAEALERFARYLGVSLKEIERAKLSIFENGEDSIVAAPILKRRILSGAVWVDGKYNYLHIDAKTGALLGLQFGRGPVYARTALTEAAIEGVALEYARTRIAEPGETTRLDRAGEAPPHARLYSIAVGEREYSVRLQLNGPVEQPGATVELFVSGVWLEREQGADSTPPAVPVMKGSPPDAWGIGYEAAKQRCAFYLGLKQSELKQIENFSLRWVDYRGAMEGGPLSKQLYEAVFTVQGRQFVLFLGPRSGELVDLAGWVAGPGGRQKRGWERTEWEAAAREYAERVLARKGEKVLIGSYEEAAQDSHLRIFGVYLGARSYQIFVRWDAEMEKGAKNISVERVTLMSALPPEDEPRGIGEGRPQYAPGLFRLMDDSKEPKKGELGHEDVVRRMIVHSMTLWGMRPEEIVDSKVVLWDFTAPALGYAQDPSLAGRRVWYCKAATRTKSCALYLDARSGAVLRTGMGYDVQTGEALGFGDGPEQRGTKPDALHSDGEEVKQCIELALGFAREFLAEEGEEVSLKEEGEGNWEPDAKTGALVLTQRVYVMLVGKESYQIALGAEIDEANPARPRSLYVAYVAFPGLF
ncbi:MAG: hypothetical protein LBD02_02520 [Christensenellaceae bacterium]|nr:hypothetical protein [Christensenellaceae bacterium]